MLVLTTERKKEEKKKKKRERKEEKGRQEEKKKLKFVGVLDKYKRKDDLAAVFVNIFLHE